MDNTQLGGYQYALPYPGGATQAQQPQLKMAPLNHSNNNPDTHNHNSLTQDSSQLYHELNNLILKTLSG